MKVIGYKQRKFTAKDTGEVIRGFNLYLTEEQTDVYGVACERVFLSEKKLGDYQPQLQDDVTLVYNRFGKVDRIVPNGGQ